IGLSLLAAAWLHLLPNIFVLSLSDPDLLGPLLCSGAIGAIYLLKRWVTVRLMNLRDDFRLNGGSLNVVSAQESDPTVKTWEEIQRGDILQLGSGDLIPVDGEVVAESALVKQRTFCLLETEKVKNV